MNTDELSDYIEDEFVYNYTDIKYTMDGVLIEDRLFSTTHPRLLFAKLLASFTHQAKNEIGDHVKIGQNCTIGGQGFGYELDEDGTWFALPHLGNVVIEDNVIIHNNTNIDRAVTGSTIIGEGSRIDSQVHIAHNVKLGKHCLVVAGTVIGGSVEVGDYTFIGMNASIKQKVKIGSRCTIGAGAIVIGDVPGGTVVKGLWK
jgi:UDP-3-O-[3-hydroxymyristoyl] glucosamine N-acyltransferase